MDKYVLRIWHCSKLGDEIEHTQLIISSDDDIDSLCMILYEKYIAECLGINPWEEDCPYCWDYVIM